MTDLERQLIGALDAIRAMAENRPRVNMPDGVSLAAFCGAVLADAREHQGARKPKKLNTAPETQRATIHGTGENQRAGARDLKNDVGALYQLYGEKGRRRP